MSPKQYAEYQRQAEVIERNKQLKEQQKKKQTAVEWLIQELGEYFPHEVGGIELVVNKAKAMEKEQIIKTGTDVDSTDFWVKYQSFEDYYNETYES